MNIVLIEPEIHWNTGNIGRTCVATGTTLHLVGKLGFSLEASQIRRSGLDYWPRLDLRVHPDIPAFLRSLPPSPSLFLFSARARRSFWSAPFKKDSYLVFGKESTGLPDSLKRRFRDRLYRIPIRSGERSLNLSTSAGVALYESLRRTRWAVGPSRA